MKKNAIYLGDGLYAVDEGDQFVLSTKRRDGDGEFTEHYVALDDDTLQSFFKFIESRRHVKITVEKQSEE